MGRCPSNFPSGSWIGRDRLWIALLKSADYELYVRDRSPHVHFTGKNYVLPRVGQEGIPVVSVNTRKIGIEIVRIGDRNLLPTIRSEDFLAQLSSYRIKQLIDTDGKKIWSGTLNTSPELNVDVTTAFPVIGAPHCTVCR